MSFKAKTVLNKDIRVFKQDINTMEDGLEAIKTFIREKYEIQGNFSIQYEDEEKDMITIASSEDLEEAYHQAENNGTVLKLLVVLENSDVPAYEFTSELDKSAINEEKQQQQQENNGTSSSDEEENGEEAKCFGKQLLEDLIKNEEFRKEFINFIVTFIKIIQQDIEKVSNEALIQALSQHENISQHPSMKKLLEIFPVLFRQLEPVLFFINTIDADNVGTWINNIINMLSNVDWNQLYSIPMMLMSWLGVPFGQGFHGHGGHHGHHGHHHGCHMPPPPPPPFWFGNPYGSFMPQPPPPCGPFGFNGFPHPFGFGHGPHHPHHGHGRGHGHGHRFGRHGCRKDFGNEFNGCPMFKGCSNNNNNGEEKWKNKCNGKDGWKKYHKWCHKMNKQHNKKEENEEYNVEIINDEISLIDKAYVLPGQVIIKTWHVKNNGKQDWPQGMKLKYYGKSFNPIINGVEFNIPSLKINEESDISVNIETPTDSNFFGKQKANFRLVLPNNNKIGPVFRVRVMIVNEMETLNNNNNNNNNNYSEKNEEIEEKKENNENEETDIIKQLKEIKEQAEKQPILEAISIPEKQLKNESSPSSFADVHVPKIDEINFDDDENELIEPPQDQLQHVIIEEPKDDNNNKNIPIMESNLNHKDESVYKYEKELNTLLNMGFNDVEAIRHLLNTNNGDINVVINQLFA